MSTKREKILVTGGAGFIGSHLVDALIKDGYGVRVLDNLSRPAHNRKLPEWFNKKAKFIKGDVRNKKDWIKALKGVDYVIHLASYMDIFSDFSTYIVTNAVGTALMCEVIVEKKYPIKKIVAASSQSVYGESKYKCKKHGIVYPDIRNVKDLKRERWEIKCPLNSKEAITPLPEDENDELKPVGAYGASKVALEQILFSLGKLYNIPSVALRYSIVQGSRQSFRHFYSGALRAYAVMALSGQTIITHEDGKQLRDLVNVHDLVDAHIAVLKNPKANFQAFNVGSGKSIRLIDLADKIRKAVNPKLKILAGGKFRWATTRHSLMNISKLKKLGWRPKRTVEDSIQEYIDWVKNYPEAKKYLTTTNRDMKKRKLVR